MDKSQLIWVLVVVAIVIVVIVMMKKKEKPTNLTSRMMKAAKKMRNSSSGGRVVSPIMTSSSSSSAYQQNMKNMMNAMHGINREGFLDTYMTNVPDSNNMQFSSPPYKSPFVGQMDDSVHQMSSDWDSIEEISDN
jgi:aspartate/tyrosine/aromatic aminotransferase